MDEILSTLAVYVFVPLMLLFFAWHIWHLFMLFTGRGRGTGGGTDSLSEPKE